MSDTSTLDQPGSAPVVPDAGPGRTPQPSLGILLAGLLAGAGIIHLVMVPAHLGGGSWIDPLAFATVGWLQIALAVALVLGRGNRTLHVSSIVVNLAVLGLWAASRTVGLPIGAHVGIVEPVGAVDGVCAVLEVAAVLVALVMVVAPARLRFGVLGPSLAAVAVLGLATVAIVSPDAASHGGHDHGAAAGHDHGQLAADHATDMVAIDRRRCDLGFNPRSYWDDAPRMGVDTYAGGPMAAHPAPSLMDQVTAADPFDGRGSKGLDQLISATSEAAGGESAAANLVNRLSAASTDDYEAWVRWMGATAMAGTATSSGHSHGAATTAAPGATSTAAPDDNHGHGGHAGPQPWKAMVDQEQCVQLSRELAAARDTALAHPTAADAMADGYTKVTPYVPGIAAHYMKFAIVDGEFRVDQPEMILYDGDGPGAHVVGLSYYLLLKGESEPSQGFTGGNDHFHRHVGLCTKPGAGVIGDSTTTPEQCRAMGGFKADGSTGWMSHAWVVPGCESPWGVFSGASPTLDLPLATVSGTNDGACSATGVRARYDLRPGGKQPSGTGESAGGD